MLVNCAEACRTSRRSCSTRATASCSAHLDLDEAGRRSDSARARSRGADVFTQGYRSGRAWSVAASAPDDVAAMRPGIVYVSINCYGHTGPWRERPGWEQLAQTVTRHRRRAGQRRRQPQLIPAAACDYTTGYLAAYGVDDGARSPRDRGRQLARAGVARARPAMWFTRLGATCDPAAATGIGDLGRLHDGRHETPFGPARRTCAPGRCADVGDGSRAGIAADRSPLGDARSRVAFGR